MIDNAKNENMASNDDLRVYEIGYLLVPTVQENDVPEEVSNIKSVVEKLGGLFVSEGDPQLRELTYVMSRKNPDGREDYDSAYFGWVKFDFDPEKLGELEEEIKKIKNVLRFLVVKTVRENTMAVIAKKPKKTEEGEKAGGDDKKKDETESVDEKKVDEDKGNDKKEEKEKEEKEDDAKKEEEMDKTIDDLVIN